jgi:hypothetical protein
MDKQKLKREGRRLRAQLARPYDRMWEKRRARWSCFYPETRYPPEVNEDASKILLRGPSHPTNDQIRAAVENDFIGAIRREGEGRLKETIITLHDSSKRYTER